MSQYGFLINLHRCIGCRTCTISCKMENSLPAGVQRMRVLNGDGQTTYDKPQGTYPDKLDFLWRPVPCQQCDSPACMDVCPVGAITKRSEDGIVVIDKSVCTGCQACVNACPFGSVVYDADAGVADKCDMCLHRLEAGIAKPICELCCPNRAITVGDLDDSSSQIAKLIAGQTTEQLDDTAGVGPNVYYWRSVTKTSL